MTDFDTPKTPAAFVETMLRSSIEADQLVSEYINDTPLRQAETHAAVNGLIAAMAMEMLRRNAPDVADAAAEQLDQIFTAGDVGGPAYRTAKGLGHDPDQWIAAYEERAARRKTSADRGRNEAKDETEQARRIAVTLEQENARLRELAQKLVDGWKQASAEHAQFAESKVMAEYPGLADKQEGRSLQLLDCADELADVLNGEDPDDWEHGIGVDVIERDERDAETVTA